ncbi:hypothetical protein SO802_010669 [Lithocarpus litseifolius]|uniref:Nucleolar complex-associated protein 3 N-terminal domain-containing protein n=1 Tax=Lithocarpus litseifolius TaxID=425828 RepID=A0AAW2DH37_9ROSI
MCYSDRNVTKTSTLSELGDEEAGSMDKGIVRLTKLERRAKLKKQRKEAKKLGRELEKVEEVQQTPQAVVLQKLAELGMALLANPEPNIKSLKSLKETLQIFKDNDLAIAKLGVLSMLVVFKDIILGYRIWLPTEKELEMKVSKDVKKMRIYESTLLSAYKHVAVRCICTLLDAVPHFNFQEGLLGVIVRNIGSSDDVIRFYTFGRLHLRTCVKVEGKNMIVKKDDIIEEKFMSKVEKAAKAQQ